MRWLILLGVLAPSVALLLWFLFGAHFLPAQRLQRFSYVISPPIALLMSAFVARPLWAEVRDLGRRGKRLAQLGKLGTMAFAPLLLFWIQHMFWVGGLMFVLHTLAPAQPATLVEPVAPRSIRHCRNSLELPGDSLLTPRRLCRVDHAFYRTLRRGDLVRFTGQASAFGFHVQAYSKLESTVPRRRGAPSQGGAEVAPP